MIDVSGTIESKSDQLNSIDLISGEKTLEITGIKVIKDPAQPIIIGYKGADGHPYKPCKSMRRILVIGWGCNGEDYVGRKIVVYNDPAVRFAGANVGGIRISAMSHIKQDINTMLPVSRGKKAPYEVIKLETEAKNKLSEETSQEYQKEINKAQSMADLQVIRKGINKLNLDSLGNKILGDFYTIAKDRINTPQEIGRAHV